MTILLALIPLAVLLVALAAWFFIWAVRSGQYDDLDAPAVDILRDDAPSILPAPGDARATDVKPPVS